MALSQSEQHLNTWIRRSFWIAAIVLGLLQSWANRTDIVDDAVNFLDMGDHIWRGHWSLAINGMWNPLYAVILGACNRLLRPSPEWEYPLVHLILFFIFLLALCCFDFFLRELISFRQSREAKGELSVPLWVWSTIGYVLFLWSSLQLIGVKETNPDMLVAAFFYLASGLIIRIQRDKAHWSSYVSLGLALGFGYLSKSIMFPVSVICLGIALILGLRQKQARHALGAILVFVVVVAPFIAALSVAKGRFSFGEAGHYNYAFYVNHLPRLYWQGEVPGSGRPVHPARQIFHQPATFEFATPLDATYAAWYDISYWYDGVKTPIDLRAELKNIGKTTLWEFGFLAGPGGSVFAGLFALFYVGARKWAVLRDVNEYHSVLLPALAAMGLYSLVHFEPRYVAMFVIVIALSLFFAVRLPESIISRRLYSSVALLIFSLFVTPTEWAVHDIVNELRLTYHASAKNDPNSYPRIANDMRSLGLRPGDRIASLEYSSYNTVQWAYLARVKIISEVYYWPTVSETLDNDFWKADPATQEQVIQAFRKTGARAIVSQLVPSSSPHEGWLRVGESRYWLYWLDDERGIWPAKIANSKAAAR